MQKLVIEGGVPLEGEVFLHGAKNSALPILAAVLLCDGETTLENCARLTDVFAGLPDSDSFGVSLYDSLTYSDSECM